MLYKIGDTVIFAWNNERYVGNIEYLKDRCCRLIYSIPGKKSIGRLLTMVSKVTVMRIGDMVVVPIAGGSFKVGHITSIEDDETCYVAGVEGAVDLLDVIPTYTW